MQIQKLIPEAVVPTKAHADDAGFDLTILHKVKEYGDDVVLYGTGIAVQPPRGVFTILVPRSSISKTGYMIANSPGVVDWPYTGEIMVALRKLRPDADPIELPCRIAQLVPLSMVPLGDPQIVETLGEKTERGAGGFGSTG
jgi:dUTP pyrophosphatase